MKSKVIYLIQGSRGTYSDKTDWNVTALVDESDAMRVAELMNELARKIHLLDHYVFGGCLGDDDKVPVYEVSKVPLPSAEVREAAGLSGDPDFAKLVEELGV